MTWQKHVFYDSLTPQQTTIKMSNILLLNIEKDCLDPESLIDSFLQNEGVNKVNMKDYVTDLIKEKIFDSSNQSIVSINDPKSVTQTEKSLKLDLKV